MRRLYVQIYLTIIASLVLVVMVSGALWQFGGREQFNRDAFEIAGKLAVTSLATIDAPIDIQRQKILDLAQYLQLDIAVYKNDFSLVATSNSILPQPLRDVKQGDHIRGPKGPVWQILLPDSRWLIVGIHRDRQFRFLGPIVLLGAIALVIALCAFPVVRRMTRRLERLQEGVERVGSGDFSARVAIEGKDEIARLAESFNSAAEHIEKLLGAHQQLLANASHELRTPLSRIRLGIDLLKGSGDKARKVALEQDINELDQLVDEILLMSRLDANHKSQSEEKVDLLAIAAEECARYEDCVLDGKSVEITGNPRLLQRLVRNLLENASRHGQPPIELRITCEGDRAIIEVLDHGSGIPIELHEKALAPFYRIPGQQDVKGYGLGLALVAQIAKSHGGEVSMFDEAKTGMFGIRVSLPIEL